MTLTTLRNTNTQVTQFADDPSLSYTYGNNTEIETHAKSTKSTRSMDKYMGI